MNQAYFKTFGCKVNQYETQLIREQLHTRGISGTDSLSSADICIINSCTVTHNADADCRQIIRRILKENPSARIIVTGCLAVTEPEQLKSIAGAVELCPDKSAVPDLFGKPSEPSPSLITAFHKHTTAFIKIQDGCDCFCSYCIVPYARPGLWSKSKKDVLQEVTNLKANGYTSLLLCGIRLGKYEAPDEPGCNLTSITGHILSIHDTATLRFSSLEIGDFSDEFIAQLASDKRISRHLHIPMQSGDDDILRRMRRPYTVREFNDRINIIRASVPDIEITSDIMVGFPGETHQQFTNTLKAVQTNKFAKLHVFRYSPRPHTDCGQPSKTPEWSQEIKKRAEVLRNSVS